MRSKWKSIVSTIKAHEQFKNYSLAESVGILKSHENEVMKDTKLVTSFSLLTLETKSESLKKKKTKIVVEDSESDISHEELTKEDKVMMVTNPNKFFKKNFSRFRNNKNKFVGKNHKQESSRLEKSWNESFKKLSKR